MKNNFRGDKLDNNIAAVGYFAAILGSIIIVKIGIISHSERGDGIKSRASYLGINHCYVGNDPKEKILLEWIEEENIKLEDVAFIGDDINDMSIIEIVGFSACPSDASTPVKQKVSLILKTKGGYGCVREFSDLYLAQNT